MCISNANKQCAQLKLDKNLKKKNLSDMCILKPRESQPTIKADNIDQSRSATQV